MCVGNFHWKKGSCTNLLTYFWKNFTPGIKWSRFFCWRTNFFFYLGQPLVQFSSESADFAIISSWSSKTSPGRFHVINVPSEYAPPLPKFQRQNLFNQNRSTIYWLIFKTDSILHVVISQLQVYCFCKGHKIICLKRV